MKLTKHNYVIKSGIEYLLLTLQKIIGGNTMRKNHKKYVVIGMAMAFLATSVPSITTQAASRPKLSKSSLTMTVGESKKLTVKNTKKVIKWVTGNKKVAVVVKTGKKSAKVTAKKPGSIKITAKVAGKSLNCKVKVVAKVNDEVVRTVVPTESVGPAAPSTTAQSGVQNTPVTQNTIMPATNIPNTSKEPTPTEVVGSTNAPSENENIKPLPGENPGSEQAILEFSDDGKKVISVKNKETATYAIIPDGVITIGDRAFMQCYNLISVTIPNSVVGIGFAAFASCPSLESITISENVNYIGELAFLQCSGLESITILNSSTIIYDDTFSGCYFTSDNIHNNKHSDLSYSGATIVDSETNGLCIKNNSLVRVRKKVSGDIVIPNDITSIGKRAFSNCDKITNITIPNSVTAIKEGAFLDCNKLTNIVIPNSVTTIEDYTFERCSGLTSVVIPDTVTSLGEYVFADCSSLTSIAIPSSITSITNDTFNGCTGLTTVTIPNSVTVIGYGAFYKCSNLTDLIIPDSVTFISANAFYGCSNLTNLIIPDSVTTIREDAFYNVPHITYNGPATGAPWGALEMN